MCAVTLSDKLRTPLLTRLLFSALVIVVVDHRRLGSPQNQHRKEILTSAHIAIQDTLQGKRLAVDIQLSVC